MLSMSYLDGVCDERYFELFCGVLLPGFILNSTKHSYVVSIYFFFFWHLVKVQVVQLYSSTYTATTRKNCCFFLSERSANIKS